MARVALVTGGSRGIGAAVSKALQAAGYKVAANYAGNDEAAQAFTRQTGIPTYKWSVADYESCVAGIKAVENDFGPVEVLVNNAGITGAGSVEETPIATYQAMFDTNVLGVVRCIQQVLPGMREARCGRIVNISSSSAIQSPPLMAPYATTKMAVEGISESLQAEVAPFGIRVIAIQAGTILTPIWGKNPPPPEDTPYPAARDFLLKVLSHQLMNSGTPADAVADVIAAAIEAIHDRGMGGLTMGDIARRAGVSSALAHHYFGSKEGVLLAVMERGAERFVEALPVPDSRMGSQVNHLRVVVEAVSDSLERNPDFLRMLVVTATQPVKAESEEVQLVVHRVRELALTRLRVQMEIVFGVERDSDQADYLARFALVAFDGAFVASQANKEIGLRDLLIHLPEALKAVERNL